MAQRKIQLLRSNSIYNTKQDAIDSFTTELATSANLSDGEILLARYKATVDQQASIKAVLGVYNDKVDESEVRRKGFTMIVDNETIDGLIQGIQSELDATQSGVGLGTDGSYTGYSSDDVVGTTTTLKDTVDAIVTYVKGLDLTQEGGGDGDVITAVSQADGQVSASASTLTDVLMTGYSKTNDTGAIAATDTLEEAFSKVENAITASTSANTVSSSDSSISVTPSANGTDVIVNVDGTTIVKDGTTGELKSGLTLAKITTGLSTNVKEAYQLQNTSGTQIGAQIDIYKDSSLLSVALLHADLTANPQLKPTYANGTWTDIASASQTEENLALCFAYQLADGTTSVEAVPVGNFLRESEFGDGLQVTNGVVSVLIDPASESYLTVSSSGVKLDGIDAAIAVETTRAQAAEDEIAGLVGLGGTEGQRTFTPTTNYGTGATDVMANMENIATVLSGISSTVSGTAYLPSDAISVTQSQQQGHENEHTIALELSAESDNILSIKNSGNKGLYLSSTWDCGEY